VSGNDDGSLCTTLTHRVEYKCLQRGKVVLRLSMVATDLHDTIQFAWTKECGASSHVAPPMHSSPLERMITRPSSLAPQRRHLAHQSDLRRPTLPQTEPCCSCTAPSSSDRSGAHVWQVCVNNTWCSPCPWSSTLTVVTIGAMIVWGYQTWAKRQRETLLARRRAVEQDIYTF
jgi:hypothetical protein